MSNSQILIVDDEADIRRLIRGILEDEGYDVLEAENSKEALSVFETKKPDLAILDIWLQGSEKDGMEILEHYKSLAPHFPVLMISGHGNIETAVNAIKIGAYDFIEKPFKSDRLLLMIARGLEAAQLKQQNSKYKKREEVFEDIIFSLSSELKGFQSQLFKALNGTNPVFIESNNDVLKEKIIRFFKENQKGISETPDGADIVTIPSMSPKTESQVNFDDLPLREARETFEKQYLLTQIGKFNGNISQTASFVGMERSALHRKLKSLDISPDDAQNVDGALNRHIG